MNGGIASSNARSRPQHADPGRPVQLVAGEHVEVRTQRLHVDRPVHHSLGPVQQQLRPGCMCQGRDPRRRRHRAQHVGHVRDRDQAHPSVRQQRLERRHVELAGIGHRRHPQFDPAPVAQHLPGHDVGVVLHLGDQHRLVRPQQRAVAVRDQVDGAGRAAGEHDLVARRRVQQGRHLVAHALIGVGGALAHPVQPAMHVGVLGAHRVHHRLDHRVRLLRRGGAVEEHERLAAHRLLQDREVGAQVRQVGRYRDRRDRIHDARPFHQPATASSSAPRIISSSTSCSASSRNARTSMARASATGTPRLRM